MSSDPNLMTAAVKSLWDGRPGVLILGLRQRSMKEREVSSALSSVGMLTPAKGHVWLVSHPCCCKFVLAKFFHVH